MMTRYRFMKGYSPYSVAVGTPAEVIKDRRTEGSI